MDLEDAEMDGDYLLDLDKKSDDLPRGDSQKLKLALKKRQIVEEERGRLHKVVQEIRMRHARMKGKISGAEIKLLEDDPFVKFYLEIYRELCGKSNIEEITREVFGRWKKMKKKPRTTLRKIYTDPHVTFGLAWELALGEKQANGTNQLKFALMKNKIVSEEITRLANFVRNMHKEKHSVPFLKTYLKVFREMCGKSSLREIRGEAMRRYMTAKQSKPESKAERKMKNKSKKVLRSKLFGKRKKLHECPTHGQAGRKDHTNRDLCSVPTKKCLYHGPTSTSSNM